MGLDVYLRKYTNLKKTIRDEQLYQEELNKLLNEGILVTYKAYEKMTPKEKKTYDRTIEPVCLALEYKYNVDSWGTSKRSKKDIILESKNYPSHCFQIGYFRSSYNESGIDYFLIEHLNTCLAKIFSAPIDRDSVLRIFIPDWKKSLKLAQTLAKRIRKNRENLVSKRFTLGDIDSFAQALDIVAETCDYVLKQKEMEK